MNQMNHEGAAAPGQALEQPQQQEAPAGQANGQPGEAAVPAAAAAAAGAPPSQQQPAAQQQQQQQQGQRPAGTAAVEPATGGDANGADGEHGPALKKRRLTPPPDFSYEPSAAVDLVLKTADGKRLGVHRLIVLRSCGFFRALLDACEEAEVAVPEGFEEVKAHLLDIIYSRSVLIKPEIAMKVFQLADKYEAEDIMQACRPVFMSEAFKMRIATPAPEPAFPFGMGASAAAAAAAHAEWLDVLALASKHRYEDLFDKATDFLVEESKDAECLPVEAATVLMRGKEQLAQLHQFHLLKLVATFALCTHNMHKKMNKEVEETNSKLKDSQGLVAKLEKKVAERQKTYMKLLAKFNRLVNRCEKEGLTWHRELDPKEPGGKKKKKAAAVGPAQ